MAIDINIPSQVKNYTNLAAFPASGALKTIYIANDTNKTYRWTGTAYVEISATAASTWGAIGGTLSNQTDLQTALDGKVDENATITGATKTKITYDSKGLVTAGADATTADIADSTNKRYVTDANLTVINNTSGTNTGDQTLSGLGGVPTSRTISTTAPLSGGGDLSADRTLSIATANTTTTGALSSTDWNTFNGKQSTLVSGTNIKTINGTTILGSGDLTISTGITIGTTAITSGTVGRVLFEGTGNVVQESANLFWDNTNGRLGIGGTPGAFNLDVVGTARVSSNINTSGQYTNVNTNNFTTAPIALRTIGADISGISIYKASFGHTNSIQFLSNDVNNRFSIGQGYIGVSSSIDFNIARFASSAWTNAFTIFNATGNITINSATDAGFKLDVNGTFRAQTSSYGVAIETANNGIIKSAGGYQNTDGSYTANGNLFLKAGLSGTGNIYITNNNGNAGAFGLFVSGTTVNIGNGISVLSSAIFQLNSTTKGFLPPRMTTTEKNAIASPATGLMVYDTTLNLISVYNGTIWISL